MKTLLTILAFCFLTYTSYSQDYMEQIVNSACECVNSITGDLTVEERNLQLGLCIIEATKPYHDEIKRDFNIDVNNIETEGEELGRIVGMKMAYQCPEFISMYQDDSEPPLENIVGTVVLVEKDLFVVFSVKDESGKVTKYYWLTFIESNHDLSLDYASLAGKKVDIFYNLHEFFDPRLNEYRIFNVISTLDVVE